MIFSHEKNIFLNFFSKNHQKIYLLKNSHEKSFINKKHQLRDQN